MPPIASLMASLIDPLVMMASLIAPLIRPIEPTLWRALNDNELGSGQVR